MNTKHTPGPWMVKECPPRKNTITPRFFVRSGNFNVCSFDIAGRQHDAEMANARLIAAAPDLLEAALKIYAHLNARIDAAPGTAVPVFDGLAELHTAIAKATSDL